MMKKLALLTLDEALRQATWEAPPAYRRPAFECTVTRRPLAPSPACLPSRTREYVLPPQLLSGPFSIKLR
jgi:hypothetical protein